MTAKEYNDCTRLWADDAMRFAVRCGGNREDSEDAVQEALAALWRRHDEIPVEKGKSFLFTSAYRQLLWYFRRHRVERRFLAIESKITTEKQEPDERFDLREAIEWSLRTLPEVQRAILQLRDVEGYSYREIGEALQLNEDQVQVYLFRARVAMRKQLKTMGYDEYK